MAIVRQTAVSVRFSGDDLDPADVTQALGATPDIAYRKGDAVRDGRGIGRTGLCSFRAPRATPGDLDGQITRLLDGLSPDLAIWRDLSQRYRGEVFIGLFLTESNEGMGIASATIDALAQRGLQIDLDIYYRG
jgi:hypothetical protein